MARLGTHDHPAIVRLKTPERANAAMAIARAYGWQLIAGVEPDETEDVTDIEYMLAEAAPRPKVGRNDPCPCGSGQKHKKCCANLPSPAFRLLEEALKATTGEIEAPPSP